jgi:hypothetical protein
MFDKDSETAAEKVERLLDQWTDREGKALSPRAREAFRQLAEAIDEATIEHGPERTRAELHKIIATLARGETH